MKLKPLADRILVKRVDQDEKSKGGIIIPDSAQEKPQEAEIVAVGDGKQLENGQVRKLALKIGDRVLLTKYSGSEIKLDGVEHLILREEDVLAVVQ